MPVMPNSPENAPPDPPSSADRVKIEFLVNPEDPNLLAGLESLVRLGLLSDRKMRQIARQALTCSRPIPPIGSPVAPPIESESTESESTLINSGTFIADPEPARTRRSPAHTDRSAPQTAPALVPKVLTSFMAEISVIWLLFLGVFLVVVSSASLAAMQWRNFSAIGQYGILLIYTLMFGAAGLWASGRENLQVTGRMLQVATLLIIPVNFWMMDGFRLWANPIGWVTIAIATAALGALQWKLLQGVSPRNRWNSLLLNGLHWGWAITIIPVPLIFTYIGTIITAFIQSIAQRSRNAQEEEARSLPMLSIAFATFLLVGRAILVKGIPISRFGFAIAIVGWVIYWTNRKFTTSLWAQVGAALLGIGWLVSYIPDPALVASRIDPLWQPLAISGFAMWVLSHRLHRTWEKSVLVGFWGIGLQTYTVMRVLIPPSTRQSIMTLIADWANLQAGAWELSGLGFFSYIILSLIGAGYLRRRQQGDLAILTEQLAFLLGVALIVPSLINPLVRSIYFSLSTITVAILWLRRRSRSDDPTVGHLVYLAHTTGAIALFSWILWLFPQFSTQQWAGILLTGTLVEWAFAAISRDPFWQKSAWLLGLAQATCAYPLLLDNLQMDGRDAYVGLPWLVVPITLTALAYTANFAYGSIAVWLSVGSLFLGLVITFTSLNPFLIALGMATLLMFANTAKLRQMALAVMTVGDGLLWLGLQSWSLLHKPEPKWYLVGVAIALWLVWIGRDLLVRWAEHHDSEELSLPHLYYVAVNGWGRGLGLAMGLILGAIVLIGFMLPDDSLPWQELFLAGVLSFSAIGYRVWQEPTALGLWGLAIGAEILVNLAAEWIGAPLDYRVIVTLLLGMGTQLIGDWWVQRPGPPDRNKTAWTAFNGVPGAYAGLALLLAHTNFTARTGLYTIAISLILMMVGRRSQRLQSLRYIGFVGTSIGVYEYVLHWLSQASGGSLGDGVTILALVSAALALGYQAMGDRLAALIRIESRYFNTFSRLHWFLGTLLTIGAILAGLSSLGEWFWIVAGIALTINILWQGREESVWIYLGFWQLVFTLGFLLPKLLPIGFLNAWAAVFASMFAYGIFTTDWEAFGWAKTPWQRSATALPLTIALLTASTINTPCLLLTAAFYGLYAWQTEQVRRSYFGIALSLWGLFKWLLELNVTEPLWYTAMLAIAALFIVEIEPTLQVNSARATRHWLRCFALGLFCVTLFYDPWDIAWLRGVMTIVVAFGLVLVGLIRRTRAYLYIGTITFVIGVLRILWLFIADYSLLLWAVGIVLGLMLIWIAATFEARRSQTIAFVEYWLQELDAWE
jgi:hypothetical protein